MKTTKIASLALILLTFLMGSSAYGQAVLSGKITDEGNGEPLIGASITIKGTTIGTVTNYDGEYTISASEDSGILLISYIGYVSKELSFSGDQTIDINLAINAQDLDELIVIGYGKKKKSHLTGSVSQLTNNGLDDAPVSRADQMLQGRLAGLSIKNISGDVGAALEIRVRGMGSISADNSPLIVVDGYPIPDDLSSVDMADIQSIEILKDAASTAIYGSRGSNGVILITTKVGDEKNPSYNLSVSTGFKTAVKKHDIISSLDWVDDELYIDQANENYTARLEGRDPVTKEYDSRGNTIRYIGENTDWQEEALRDPAKTENYKLSVSGGSSKSRYYISGSYTADEGLLKDNYYDKLNLRMKIDAKLSDRVSVGMNFSPSYSKQRRSTLGLHDYARTYGWLPAYHTELTSELTGEPVGSFAHPRHFAATPVYDEFGEPVYNDKGELTTINIWSSANNNPLSRSISRTRFNTKYRFYGNSYIDIRLTDGLNFRSTVGGYVRSSIDEDFMSSQGDDSGIPEGYYRNNMTTDLLTENYFTYDKEFSGKHTLNILAGFSAQRTDGLDARVLGSNQPTDFIPTLNAASEISQDTDETYSYIDQISLLSYLSRISYAYDDKYLVTVSSRWDGSSLFGPEDRWAWFPSASLGWRLSEEGFMENVDKVDQLKLRASYGLSGNNDIENYAHTNTVTTSNYIFGLGDGNIIPGLRQSNPTLANPGITWERTYESDFGIDLSMFRNRVVLAADYYYAITDQLLLQDRIPYHSGFTNEWANKGKVRNLGVELELKVYPVQSTDNFSWALSGNISTNKNKLIDFGGDEQLISEAYRGHKYLAKVGEPSIQFFGYKTDGIWESAEEIANNVSNADAVPGGLKFVDTNDDGTINENDRVVLGSPFPDYIWGISNDIRYGNFNLSFLFQGSVGNELFNANGYYYEMLRLDEAYNAGLQYINPDYPGDGLTPSVSAKANFLLTDYLVEDGSYVALRNLTLGYKAPQKVSEFMNMKSLRVYVSAQNLLYFMSKDYRGINPESVDDGDDYDSPLKTGAQRGAQPIARTVVFGIDVKF